MLLYSFEFKFHSITNNINKTTRSNYVNEYQSELLCIPRKNLKLELQSHEKELSMNINTRPFNMAPEGNNISPRNLSVNAKKASGMFLITLLIADKLAQMYTRSYIYILSRVKGSHLFCVQNGPKKIFYGKTILTRKKIMFLYIFFKDKSWQWSKVNLGTVI